MALSGRMRTLRGPPGPAGTSISEISRVCCSSYSSRRSLRVHGSPPERGDAHLSGQDSIVAPAALAVSLVSALRPAPALAADVDSAVGSIVEGVKAGGDLVKKGLGIVESGVDVAKEGYGSTAPVVEGIVKKTAPVVSGATEPVLKAAGPAVREAERALSASGVDVESIKAGAGAAVDAATPVVRGLGEFLTTSSPVVLAECAAGAIALYVFGPSVLGALLTFVRGYAGERSAVAAVDALKTESDAFLVDIRPRAEKEASGTPDMPRGLGGKLIEVEFAYTEDRRLRGKLRNPGEVEVQITALRIAALRKVSKASRIFVMDRNGVVAKAVARQLGRRGFKECYVVSFGFAGWLACKLKMKQLTSVYKAEVIPPSVGTIFGTRTKKLPSSAAAETKALKGDARKSLPPGTQSVSERKK